jgi:predicted Zn-dependent protease
MASVLSSLGRFDDAEQIIDNLPVTHRNSPTARATRGSVLARAGKFDQALLILNQAMTPPNAERSGILDSLVRIYASTGHYKEAQHSLRQLASPPDKLPLEDPSIFGIGPASTYGSPTLE